MTRLFSISVFLLIIIVSVMAANVDNYIVANADGYLLMHNNSSNFDLLQNVPFMNFLLNRMGLGMMLQLSLSSNGLNAAVINDVFGGDVEIIYKESQNFMCAFANSNISPEDFIKKFTPQSTEIIKRKTYSYIKNGEDYAVFFNSGVFSYMSGITPEKYMELLKSDGIFHNTLPQSKWISMDLKLNSKDLANLPANLPDESNIQNKKLDLKATVDIQDKKLIISLYANTKLDASIQKLLANSSTDKTWFGKVRYFGSGIYGILSIDNINSIFDYAEQSAKPTDKQLIDSFKNYADYFTGRAYLYVPLTIGDILSSDNAENSNYVLAFQYKNSNLLNLFDDNKQLSKSIKSGLEYYETTDSGTKTYIYINNDYIYLSDIKPSSFSKLLSNSTKPISVKSYNILRKYIQTGVASFYWDIGEDLEKSMYLKAPFNESGAIMNLDYKNGDLQLLLIIH